MTPPFPSASSVPYGRVGKAGGVVEAMWNLLRIVAVLIGALLFLVLPMMVRDSLPDPLFNAWDALLSPLRTPVNAFWWQIFHRYDQQPLFQLSTLLSQAVLITVMVEAVRWIWRKRTA